MRPDTGSARPSFVFGGFLVVLGVSFLLNNFGLLSLDEFWRYWPVILIAIGAARIAQSQCESGKIFGGILVLIGSALLVDSLGIFHLRIGRYWPVILIGIGVLFVLRTLESDRARGPQGADTSTLNDWTIFGGVEKRVSSQEFCGGELAALFGGLNVDLTKAKSATPEVVIDANAMFGGIEIRVPETWTVSLQGTSAFGGFTDSTAHSKLDATKPETLLILRGFAAFGGVEVKN